MKIQVNVSATAKMHAKVLERKAQGLAVYDFSVGEPDLPTHPVIEKCVIEKLKKEKLVYPPLAGLPELQVAATQWMNQLYGCDYQPNECLVVTGAKFGLYLLMQKLLQAGDEVLIPSPYWVSYLDMTQLNQARPVVIETHEREGWKLSPEMLRKNITGKTKILVLNNPGNPSGVLYTESELKALLEIAYENRILVIADEVYSGLIYDGHQFFYCGSFKKYKNNVIVLQSCSKNFAMTGWRVGFVFGNTELISSLIPAISQTTSGVSLLCQWAAIAAFENAHEIMRVVKKSMQEQRDQLTKDLNVLAPSAGLYLFLPLAKFTTEKNSAEFCLNLLEQKGIAMVPGSAFGKEGYVRLSFGNFLKIRGIL